ncbi:hypothetical protein BCR34DRAFT_605836 [Clohesyomyces aquaticus]|uniref:PHD-type domain-containing protein n=1 Tax=Clohesyomyces aquaticus TaxID=1231657 RepID=A0A1Y1YUI6_9PLEO|nr:hypothetical protein BCR34DRAFT_605836 [Clohesyomyces aquaticus]
MDFSLPIHPKPEPEAIQTPRHPDTQTPRHPDTQTPRHPGGLGSAQYQTEGTSSGTAIDLTIEKDESADNAIDLTMDSGSESRPKVPPHVPHPRQSTTKLPGRLPPFLICSCRKPDDGTDLVRCADLSCPIGWFHKHCLTPQAKANITKSWEWKCLGCKAKAGEVEKDCLADIEKSIKEDALAELAVPAPNAGVKNPYGLGL